MGCHGCGRSETIAEAEKRHPKPKRVTKLVGKYIEECPQNPTVHTFVNTPIALSPRTEGMHFLGNIGAGTVLCGLSGWRGREM